MNITPEIITAVGIAVTVTIAISGGTFALLKHFDKLKTQNLTMAITMQVMEKIAKDENGKEEKIRQMLEDVVTKNILRVSSEMRELFDAKHEDTIEKFRQSEMKTSEKIAGFESRIGRAEKDIDSLANQVREHLQRAP